MQRPAIFKTKEELRYGKQLPSLATMGLDETALTVKDVLERWLLPKEEIQEVQYNTIAITGRFLVFCAVSNEFFYFSFCLIDLDCVMFELQRA